MGTKFGRVLLGLGLAAFLISGCRKKPDVVLYTSVDREVAARIISEFEKKTGLRVEIVTDTEGTRSAGIAERLEAEKDHPQADVFWGNEPFHTIRLAASGALAEYESPAAKRIPERFKDGQRRWAGNGLRVRVIVATTDGDSASAANAITSIEDLARPRFKDRICMARPTAGTTGGYVAALYTLWGPQKFEQFFRTLKANGLSIVGGNAYVVEYVGKGQMLAGLTDNDDVASGLRNNWKIKAVIPDQGANQIGTLLVPTTLGSVKNCPHPEAARRLIDYLLSEEAEKSLIDAGFAQMSTTDAAAGKIRAMEVDYTKVAGNLPAAVDLFLRIFR